MFQAQNKPPYPDVKLDFSFLNLFSKPLGMLKTICTHDSAENLSDIDLFPKRPGNA